LLIGILIYHCVKTAFTNSLFVNSIYLLTSDPLSFLKY
jgi:hypothetical protein